MARRVDNEVVNLNLGAIVTASQSVDLPVSGGAVVRGTLATNHAFTITGVTSTFQAYFVLTQDGGGGRSFTVNGVNLSLDTTPSATTVVLVVYDGASWRQVASSNSIVGSGGSSSADSRLMVNALTADTGTITNTTALTDISGLYIPVSASPTEMWGWDAYLLVNAAGGTGGDGQLGFSVPAGTTMRWGPVTGSGTASVAGWGAVATANTPGAPQTETTTQVFGVRTGIGMVLMSGVVYAGGTAGNVQLRYAQALADTSTLQVMRGSYVRAFRLAT